MAAYNGERYIEAQLRSILDQLKSGDEIVIVDDASGDRTVECVRALQSELIRLVGHDRNCGVSRTFEDAIRLAKNEILFLSDQDDVWMPDKVSAVLAEFEKDERVTLVASDAALMDMDGNLIAESYFANRGEFRPGVIANLIRNRFGGCTMAFQASIRAEVLPLPHGYDVLHDVWIGVRNTLSHGRAVYIDRPLILNRRHSGTATGRGALSLKRKLRIRVHLLLALASFSIGRIWQRAVEKPERLLR
jgi:glycosyltransferase involved in cell wall biosynthesis